MSVEIVFDLYGRFWLWLARIFGLDDMTFSATTLTSQPGGAGEAPFAIDVERADISALIAEHSDAVYRVAYSVTRDPDLAQDVAQDALIKAWQQLPSFRGEAPLRNWILRITHNTAISTLRKRHEETRDPIDLPETATGRDVSDDVEGRLALDRFMHELDKLDDLSRSIVVLRELEAMTYEEICEVLDVALPTVKTRLLRARRVLAEALEGWES